MINESWIWKDNLLSEMSQFVKIIESPIPEDNIKYEHINFAIERFFFISSFIIRKLDESNNLSSEILSKNYSFIRYPRINPDYQIDWVNSYQLEKFYSLDKPETCSININNYCNLLIHSFIFEQMVGDTHWLGSLINSSYSKDKYLYYLSWEQSSRLIQDVINDEVACISVKRSKTESRTYTSRNSSRLVEKVESEKSNKP